MPTHDSLTRDLARLGIDPAGTLLVHASGKSVGEVPGGVDAIVGALVDFMAPGLLVMPALSWRFVDAANPEFSVLDTPGCVGSVPEHFRRRPGVVRSWHPTHSVCALGAESEAFVAGHEAFDTPCARQSPWGRLLDRRSKILFIGTGLSCNTFLHAVEEWQNVPGSLTETRQSLITVAPDGRRIPVPSRRHAGNRSKHYARMEPLFLAADAVRLGRFGDASCHLADASLMEQVTRGCLEKDIDWFGHD